MNTNRLLMITSPHPGRDAEYHAYYTDIHAPEIEGLEAVVGTTRFRVESPARVDGAPDQYALSIETSSDPAELLAEIRRRMGSGEMTAPSEAIDSTRTIAYYLYA